MDDECTNITAIANRDNVHKKEGDEMVTN